MCTTLYLYSRDEDHSLRVVADFLETKKNIYMYGLDISLGKQFKEKRKIIV